MVNVYSATFSRRVGEVADTLTATSALTSINQSYIIPLLVKNIAGNLQVQILYVISK
jgi:hypothetical protein